MKETRMKWILAFASLVLVSCASMRDRKAQNPPEITARTEFVIREVEEASPSTQDVLVLSDADLLGRRNEILNAETEDSLPTFLRAARTSLTARWVGERPVLSMRNSHVREVRARRILSFASKDGVLEAFPAILDDEVTTTTDGRFEVVAAEFSFVLLPSKHRNALRVRMDGPRVRRAATEVPSLLPASDDPVPIAFSLTLRYVLGEEEIARTVAFSDTIDVTETDYSGSSQISDWLAIPPDSVPHSIQVSVVAVEELDVLTKTWQTVFGLTGIAKDTIL